MRRASANPEKRTVRKEKQFPIRPHQGPQGKWCIRGGLTLEYHVADRHLG
ncbi:hypothetical protein ACRRTK_010506 [Alexandromys fortis]